MSEKKDPPVVLVKTWISLLTSSEDSQVKDRAKVMLIETFGDMKAVAEFAKKHQIQVKQRK